MKPKREQLLAPTVWRANRDVKPTKDPEPILTIRSHRLNERTRSTSSKPYPTTSTMTIKSHLAAINLARRWSIQNEPDMMQVRDGRTGKQELQKQSRVSSLTNLVVRLNNRRTLWVRRSVV
jgi:hypothetical protein